MRRLPLPLTKGRIRAHNCSGSIIPTAVEGQSLRNVQPCTVMHRACTVAAAQISLQGNPPLQGKVAKQPGRDVATGTGDVLSLLQALVPRADSSSSGNAAKQTARSPTAQPQQDQFSCSQGSHGHRQRMSPWLAQAVGAKRRGKMTDLVLLSLHLISSLAGPAAQSRGRSLNSCWQESGSCSLAGCCRI